MVLLFVHLVDVGARDRQLDFSRWEMMISPLGSLFSIFRRVRFSEKQFLVEGLNPVEDMIYLLEAKNLGVFCMMVVDKADSLLYSYIGGEKLSENGDTLPDSFDLEGIVRGLDSKFGNFPCEMAVARWDNSCVLEKGWFSDGHQVFDETPKRHGIWFAKGFQAEGHDFPESAKGRHSSLPWRMSPVSDEIYVTFEEITFYMTSGLKLGLSRTDSMSDVWFGTEVDGHRMSIVSDVYKLLSCIGRGMMSLSAAGQIIVTCVAICSAIGRDGHNRYQILAGFSEVLTCMDVGYRGFDVLIHRTYVFPEVNATGALMVNVVPRDLFSVLMLYRSKVLMVVGIVLEDGREQFFKYDCSAGVTMATQMFDFLLRKNIVDLARTVEEVVRFSFGIAMQSIKENCFNLEAKWPCHFDVIFCVRIVRLSCGIFLCQQPFGCRVWCCKSRTRENGQNKGRRNLANGERTFQQVKNGGSHDKSMLYIHERMVGSFDPVGFCDGLERQIGLQVVNFKRRR